MRERAIWEIVGEMHDVTCHTCKPSHKMRVFKSIEYDVLDKIKLLLTAQELNVLAKRRNTVMSVYGNSIILLNPLHIQCPICGSIEAWDTRDKKMGLLVQFSTTFTSHLICTQQP